MLAQQAGAGVWASAPAVRLCNLGQIASLLRACKFPDWGLGHSFLQVCLSSSNNGSGEWISRASEGRAAGSCPHHSSHCAEDRTFMQHSPTLREAPAHDGHRWFLKACLSSGAGRKEHILHPGRLALPALGRALRNCVLGRGPRDPSTLQGQALQQGRGSVLVQLCGGSFSGRQDLLELAVQ